jgi:hypothetical protein
MAPSLSTTSSLPVALYTHTKGQQWGLAILAWERGPCRGYLFEDGVLRIFKEGFYEMLEEVDAPADKAAAVIADLRRKLGDGAPHSSGVAHARLPVPELSFEDQVRAFRVRYPEGFTDRAWIAKHRGKLDARRAKGHADAAFTEARESLAVGELDRALAENRAFQVLQTAIRLIEHTSLLTTPQIAPLHGLLPVRHATFAQSLRELLHGQGAYELRFERFVAVMSQPRRPGPTWQLATVLPALVHAEEHICVRPTTFREQAKWMAPRLILSNTPGGALYLRLVDMARAVKTALEREGLAPRDLMDVHHFMVMTLAPSAKKLFAN